MTNTKTTTKQAEIRFRQWKVDAYGLDTIRDQYQIEKSRLARDWRVSGNGNDFLNTQDGFHIVVYPIGDIWGARFTDKRTGYSRASKRPYADEAAAKLATFDAIAAYKARGR